jgi:hypothetical protein
MTVRPRWTATATSVILVLAAVAATTPSAGGFILEHDASTRQAVLAVERHSPASRVVLRDGPGDVWRLNLLPEREWVREGRRPPADILRAIVRHRANAVTVRVRIVDIRWVGSLIVAVKLLTPRAKYVIEVASTKGNRLGIHHEPLYDDTHNELLDCPGYRTRVDRNTDVATVHVPRSCMSSPAWAKARVWSSQFPPGFWQHSFADNAHNHQAETRHWTKRLYAE